MSALLGRPEQAVSVAAMAEGFSKKLREITSGDVAHLVVVEDDAPVAVLVGVEAFQAMRDELEDLRAECLAVGRLSTFNERSAVRLEDIEAKFSY